MTDQTVEQPDQAVDDEQPVGPYWERDAQLVDVSFPARTVEVIVMPYEAPAEVRFDGRIVSETIARGAFDGIERRANRIRANRDHKAERTVGRARAFHPGRQEGLVAHVHISNTDLGNETLQLCADGCLDASAGFLPMRDGMVWNGAAAYTVTKAWLGHIAFTPDPAHKGAKVLHVRTAVLASVLPPVLPASSGTPNLDAWFASERDRGVAAHLASLTR